MLRRLFLPAILATLAYGFWVSPDFKTIAAGLALFLFGMLSLEQGFKVFSGGTLELALRQSTDRLWKSMLLGVISSTATQSSSLVSLITISFLSAGLMDLAAGIGIIFGANLGTTTGAWLIAGLGLKVNIAAYAMPLLVFGALLVFQSDKVLKGMGHGLAGLGLLFLGIHYMKEGFDAFSQTIDLAQYARTGWSGLFLFTLIGIGTTVVLQSSHASMVLIITALSAGQITYENAMALAIGANVGTTITALMGSVSANIEGKRLAAAHLVFNLVTGVLAISLISQLIWAVDWIALKTGIRDFDFTLKLALFHTLFNLLGLVVMTPLIHRLVSILETRIQTPAADLTRPLYLNKAALEVPAAAVESVRKELLRLYQNAFRLIAHGLSLSRGAIKSDADLLAAARDTHRLKALDVDEYYEHHIKPLHSDIIEFISRAQATQLAPPESEALAALRHASRHIVEAVKDMKHLHKNLNRYLLTGGPAQREQYDAIRAELGTILREMSVIQEQESDSLSLDAVQIGLKDSERKMDKTLDVMIRHRQLSPEQATSLMNDIAYAFNIGGHLVEMGRTLFGEREKTRKDAEQRVALAEGDLEELMNDTENAE